MVTSSSRSYRQSFNLNDAAGSVLRGFPRKSIYVIYFSCILAICIVVLCPYSKQPVLKLAVDLNAQTFLQHKQWAISGPVPYLLLLV